MSNVDDRSLQVRLAKKCTIEVAWIWWKWL